MTQRERERKYVTAGRKGIERKVCKDLGENERLKQMVNQRDTRKNVEQIMKRRRNTNNMQKKVLVMS